jgi:hypothetical protein
MKTKKYLQVDELDFMRDAYDTSAIKGPPKKISKATEKTVSIKVLIIVHLCSYD